MADAGGRNILFVQKATPVLTITFHKVMRPRPRAWWVAVAEHRVGLHAAEQLGNTHHALWSTGKPTPVAATFDLLAEQWDALPDSATLTLQWPLTIREPAAAGPRCRMANRRP